jgi:protein-tyrosine phosphatase
MTREPAVLGDLHSHLVPGVDDGARDLEEAVAAVGILRRGGVRRILTTPHLDASILKNRDLAEERIREVQAAYRSLVLEVRKQHPDVQLARGFEVMLDVPNPDLGDPRVRMAGTRFVLVEWPRLQIPPGTTTVLRRIRGDGWMPVVAHPERYHGLDPQLAILREWTRAGAYLQVNHGSLNGRYGNEPRNRAFRILEGGMAHYLSTDYHGRPGQRLHLSHATELFRESDAMDAFGMLCRTNIERLLDDQEPHPVRPVKFRRGLLARIQGFLGRG